MERKNEQKFICADCDFVTSNKIGLKTHITKKHIKSSTISANINNCITYKSISQNHHTSAPDVLMLEDISVTNINEEEEVTVAEIKCKESENPSKQTVVSDPKIQIELKDDMINPKIDENAVVALEVEQIETTDDSSSSKESPVLIEDSTFYCSICAKSFELRESLDSHFNDKHGNYLDSKKEPYDHASTNENNLIKHSPNVHVKKLFRKTDKCQKCDKIIRTTSGRERHLEIYCEKCEKCLPERTSFNIHNGVHHAERDKTEIEHQALKKTMEFNCDTCGNVYTNASTLADHMQAMHTAILREEPFPCGKCGLVLATFPLLQKHMTEHHKFILLQCNFCEHSCETENAMQEHIVASHEEYVILHSTAKQVDNIAGKFESLESYMYQINQSLKALVNDNVAMKQELFVLRNYIDNSRKIETQESSSRGLKVPPSNPLGPPRTPSAAAPSPPQRSATSRSPPPASPCVSTPIPVTTQSVPTTIKPKKTLYIGDSISANVDFDKLEEAIQSEFVKAKAYTSVHDTTANVAKQAAKFPEQNFQDVIPDQLRKDAFRYLIIQAGSVDISNLNTKDKPEEHFEYFRQETVLSATNLFRAAEKALEDKPSIEKVVIMNQIPRYDRSDIDPLSLKSALSLLYNKTLTALWMDSSKKLKIFIGTHNIECSGAIREARYRNTMSGKFDGIHLLGSSGTKAYTESVLNILDAAKITSQEYKFHLSCPQFKYQNRRPNNSNFQRFERKKHPRNISSNYQGYIPIPTQNRFERLRHLSQGNW